MVADNDFALFGLPAAFTIDVRTLTERFRDLQRAVHPDKFAQASEAERTLSMRQATRINDAYQRLKLPLSRAQYLLELAGHGLTADKATLKDPVFLMEQMELREALGEADLAALQGMQAMLATRIAALIDALTQGFAVPAPDWKSLQTVVLKLQFMQKLVSETDQRAERLLGM